MFGSSFHSNEIAVTTSSDSIMEVVQINTLLYLVDELMDTEVPPEHPLEQQPAFAELLDLVMPLLNNTLPFYPAVNSQMVDLIADLKSTKGYSDREIALAWQEILIHFMKNSDLFKGPPKSWLQFCHSLRDLYAKANRIEITIQQFDEDGQPFEKPEKIFNYPHELADQIFIEFVDSLNQSRDTQIARAIHTFMVITKKIALSEKKKLPEEKKGKGYLQVSRHFGPAFFHALMLDSQITNLDNEWELVFFNQLYLRWLHLPQFSKPFIEKYNVFQINDILQLINCFMDPNEPQIVKIAGNSRIVDILKTELIGHLSTSLSDRKDLQAMILRLRTENEEMALASSRDFSLAWGDFLKFSFVNSQLFTHNHKALRDFQKGILHIYKKSKVTPVDVTYYTDEKVPYTLKEFSVSLDEKKSINLFSNLILTLLDSEQESDLLIAQAIHNFLFIAKKVALSEESRHPGTGFAYISKAGIGASLFHALKLIKQIDPEHQVNEFWFTVGFNNAVLTMEKLDHEFKRELYTKLRPPKLSLSDKMRRLSLSSGSGSNIIHQPSSPRNTNDETQKELRKSQPKWGSKLLDSISPPSFKRPVPEPKPKLEPGPLKFNLSLVDSKLSIAPVIPDCRGRGRGIEKKEEAHISEHIVMSRETRGEDTPRPHGVPSYTPSYQYQSSKSPGAIMASTKKSPRKESASAEQDVRESSDEEKKSSRKRKDG